MITSPARLAQHLGVRWIIANRLEFRDGIATGRLLSPVIRSRGLFAWILAAGPDGKRHRQRLVKDLDLAHVEGLERAITPAIRVTAAPERPIVHFDNKRHTDPLSVRKALSGKHIMLIGVTGFIGKVWLVNTLMEVPDVSKIYLLIRRQKSSPAARRFEKLSRILPSSILCMNATAQTCPGLSVRGSRS